MGTTRQAADTEELSERLALIQAQEELDGYLAELHAAITAEEYTRAAELKSKIPAAQAEVARFQTVVRVRAEVEQELARRAAEVERAAEEERRLKQAQVELERALVEENAAVVTVRQRPEKIAAAVDALRECMTEGLAEESRLWQARHAVNAAYQQVGDPRGGMIVSAPTDINSLIDRSEALRLIARGQGF